MAKIGGIVHPSLIQDRLQAKFSYLQEFNYAIESVLMSDEYYKDLSQELNHLIVKGGKSVLNKPGNNV